LFYHIKTELKKNLLKWLKIKELGFDDSSCFSCKESKEEADELIDGSPQCIKEGYCKHLNNVKHLIDRDGLHGNPTLFIEASGLESFEYLSEIIYSLSPYDGLKLPTAGFFGSMEGTSDMIAPDFVELLALKTNYIRNNILEERARAQMKASRQNAIRV
jgi:hypothetical protein